MQRPRIVLAEDHAEVAEQLRALLISEFDVVAVVADGQALLRTVEADRPDVVVTDVVMPGTLDGVALAQWIGRERPALYVILATAVTTAADGSAVHSYGRVVLKPYDFAQIAWIIEAALANRQ